MRKIHQLSAVVLTACAVCLVTPAGAAAGRQTSTNVSAIEHSDTVTTENLNRKNLHAAQPGKEPGLTKAAARPQTAQLSRSANKNKAIRRAIAIRRARAAKAKKAANG